MRGLQTDRTAQVVITGHAFLQNLRRGHYELGIDALPTSSTPLVKTGLRRLRALTQERESGKTDCASLFRARRSAHGDTDLSAGAGERLH